VNAAQLKIAQNPSYVPSMGGECVSIGGTCGGNDSQKICKICSVTISGSIATILARATYGGAYANLMVRVTLPEMDIVDWSELPSYAGPPCVVP
jgi:hypothetical protein